jgi:hypothetical protein
MMKSKKDEYGEADLGDIITSPLLWLVKLEEAWKIGYL